MFLATCEIVHLFFTSLTLFVICYRPVFSRDDETTSTCKLLYMYLSLNYIVCGYLTIIVRKLQIKCLKQRQDDLVLS